MAAHRRRVDVEHGGGHTLTLARDRDQPQHVVGIGRGGSVRVGRGLAHVVDHAGASPWVSTISAWRKYASEIASDSFISAASVDGDEIGHVGGGVRGAQRGSRRHGDLARRRQPAVGAQVRQHLEMGFDLVELEGDRARIRRIEQGEIDHRRARRTIT